MWLTIPALLLTSGCDKATSEPLTACGVLFEYDRATEAHAAQEYEAARTASTFPVMRQMIDDYGTTRDSIRACK